MGEMEGGISFLKRRARRRLHRPQGDGATRTLAEEGKRGAVLFFAIVTRVSLSLSLCLERAVCTCSDQFFLHRSSRVSIRLQGDELTTGNRDSYFYY